MSDQLDRILQGEDRENSSNEQIWNLFSQILVPIVILLSFVAVSEITRYRVVTQVVEEKNEQLTAAIADLQHTDVGTMGERYKIQLIDAQKQHLLYALDQEISSRREGRSPKDVKLGQEQFEDVKLGLAEFPDKRLVNLSGREIDDTAFGKFCQNFRDTVVGDVGQRAKPSYIRAVYKEVLRRAELSDPKITLDPQAEIDPIFLAASMKIPVWPLIAIELQPDDSRITPANRQFILEEIAVALVRLTAEVTKLQQGVLERLYLALLKDPEALDLETQAKARDFLQSGLTADQSASRMRDFYEFFNRRIKDHLDERGYRFLNDTWEAVNHL
jgi:hypothetical protein